MSTGGVQTLRAWGPAVALMALIFAVSAMPEPPSVPEGMTDVGAHGLVYSVLGALVLRGLAGAVWRGVTGRRALLAWLIVASYGVTDELHQRFVPGRTPDIDDWFADALGALVGILVVWACSIVLSTRRRA